MDINGVKEALRSDEYKFLRSDERLGENIVLLTLGGSHAYGMDKEGSDIDVRGIAVNTKEDILIVKDFEQVVDTATDTTVYSFNRILKLLSSNNPNTIEILGCKPEHYIYLDYIGKLLIDNRKIFLSKMCIRTFSEYARGQLRRLENKSAGLVGQAQYEKYILGSVMNAENDFKHRYFRYDDEAIKLYIDKSDRDGFDSEIYMDVNLQHYPLRDWTGMWNEMKSIVSSYNRLGKRNEKAISHDKLGKHMAHLIRLYMMCIDILEKEDIITYREDERKLLTDIRNGLYLDNDRQPIAAFYDILNEYEKKLEYAKANTSLPDIPDMKRIEELKMHVNEMIVKGERVHGGY